MLSFFSIPMVFCQILLISVNNIICSIFPDQKAWKMTILFSNYSYLKQFMKIIFVHKWINGHRVVTLMLA